MTRVDIARVSVANDGRLRVYPALPPGETFEFIYRAARRVRWDSGRGALWPATPHGGSYSRQLQTIVEAVADEYGCDLVLTHETDWQDVPPEVRRAISTLGSAPD